MRLRRAVREVSLGALFGVTLAAGLIGLARIVVPVPPSCATVCAAAGDWWVKFLVYGCWC